MHRFINPLSHLTLGESPMKQKYNFPACSATAGKPFEGGPKCPLYLRTHEHLKGQGWEQVYYHACKTGSSDLCSTKYKRIDTSKGSKQDSSVLGVLEINIEGTKSTCTLTAVILTYDPENIVSTIGHACEQQIIDDLSVFLKGKVSGKDNQ